MPYLVYADWLSEQDDPLGQLIALQCAPGRVDEARVAMLQQAEVRAALDRVPLPEDLRLEWHRGFIATVRLRRTKATTPMLWPLLEQLLTARCGAFIRGLDVAVSQFGETTKRFTDALLAVGRPPLLRRLVLRGAAPEETPRLRAAFPLLTELEIVDGAALELVATGPATCETLQVGGRLRLDPLHRAVVGRSYTADVVVTHERINRSNFSVEHDGGRWFFSHLGGTWPVLFNGEPTHARRRPLAHGDTLQPVEGLVFRFVDPP